MGSALPTRKLSWKKARRATSYSRSLERPRSRARTASWIDFVSFSAALPTRTLPDLSARARALRRAAHRPAEKSANLPAATRAPDEVIPPPAPHTPLHTHVA